MILVVEINSMYTHNSQCIAGDILKVSANID